MNPKAVADMRADPGLDDGLASAPATTPRAKHPLVVSSVYSLGFIVQRGIGMILVPFYTRAVSPSQYGVLGLLVSVGMALAVIFALGLDMAITRTYFQLADDPPKRDEYVASVWRFLVVYPLVASILLSAVTLPFTTVVRGASTFDVALMVVSTALSVAAGTVPLAVLRARQDLAGYVRLTAVVALITPSLTWLFVVALHRGVEGWFLAATVANGAALLVAVLVVPWRRDVSYSGAVVRGAVIFSLPLVPHFLSHWALAVADRIVISGIVSAASLGVYTLAATLAAPMFALLQALNAGFLPIYGRAGAGPGHEDALARAVKLQIAITIAITLAGMLLGPSAVEILAPRGYLGASGVVVWLMLGNGFVGLYFIPMNGATIGAGRRVFAFVATMTAAGVNVLLLVVLVPSGGILAAGIADAAAYFVLLVLMAVWAHARPNPVTYDFGSIAAAIALAVLAYAGCDATAPSGAWAGALVEVGWVVGFVVCLGAIEFPHQLRRLGVRASQLARG